MLFVNPPNRFTRGRIGTRRNTAGVNHHNVSVRLIGYGPPIAFLLEQGANRFGVVLI